MKLRYERSLPCCYTLTSNSFWKLSRYILYFSIVFAVIGPEPVAFRMDEMALRTRMSGGGPKKRTRWQDEPIITFEQVVQTRQAEDRNSPHPLMYQHLKVTQTLHQAAMFIRPIAFVNKETRCFKIDTIKSMVFMADNMEIVEAAGSKCSGIGAVPKLPWDGGSRAGSGGRRLTGDCLEHAIERIERTKERIDEVLVFISRHQRLVLVFTNVMGSV